MSNKKRIRKLLKKKYKPQKIYRLPPWHKVFKDYQYGIDFASQFEKKAKEAELASAKLMRMIVTAGRTSCKTDRLLRILAQPKIIVIIPGRLPNQDLLDLKKNINDQMGLLNFLPKNALQNNSQGWENISLEVPSKLNEINNLGFSLKHK